MALPPRKAGGLYGGIQFSSSSTVLPETAQEPAPAYEARTDTVLPTSTSFISATTAVVGDSLENGRNQEYTNEGGAAASAGKATAGIHIR